jgi:hypothetical protein
MCTCILSSSVGQGRKTAGAQEFESKEQGPSQKKKKDDKKKAFYVMARKCQRC